MSQQFNDNEHGKANVSILQINLEQKMIKDRGAYDGGGGIQEMGRVSKSKLIP